MIGLPGHSFSWGRPCFISAFTICTRHSKDGWTRVLGISSVCVHAWDFAYKPQVQGWNYYEFQNRAPNASTVLPSVDPRRLHRFLALKACEPMMPNLTWLYESPREFLEHKFWSHLRCPESESLKRSLGTWVSFFNLHRFTGDYYRQEIWEKSELDLLDGDIEISDGDIEAFEVWPSEARIFALMITGWVTLGCITPLDSSFSIC